MKVIRAEAFTSNEQCLVYLEKMHLPHHPAY
jgi:hypothetical protein